MSAEQRLRDIAAEYAEPGPDGECMIYGIPIRDIPPGHLRGLLRWALHQHRIWMERNMHQRKTLDEFRRARP